MIVLNRISYHPVLLLSNLLIWIKSCHISSPSSRRKKQKVAHRRREKTGVVLTAKNRFCGCFSTNAGCSQPGRGFQREAGEAIQKPKSSPARFHSCRRREKIRKLPTEEGRKQRLLQQRREEEYQVTGISLLLSKLTQVTGRRTRREEEYQVAGNCLPLSGVSKRPEEECDGKDTGKIMLDPITTQGLIRS